MTSQREDVPDVSESAWRALDQQVSASWDLLLSRSAEAEIRAAPEEAGLLFLPFPYLIAFGDTRSSDLSYMYCWDTFFVDCSLLAHGRLDLVRNHIGNHLFMVERFGFMPNMNLRYGVSRSQTPVFPEGVWRYYLASADLDLLRRAYPTLKTEYQDYWLAPHHQTPIGLATNRDHGDRTLTPELAAEAETGLDWTPIYRGDVRRCAPLITNCALVRYADVLARIAAELGDEKEAADFSRQAEERAALIRQYCWNDDRGLFMEYDHVAGELLPYVSCCTFWPLWAGVATEEQAHRVALGSAALEHRYGLAFTDRAYPDPHPAPERPVPLPGVPPAAVGGLGQLQWMFPAGWACMQMIAVEGLDTYGMPGDARRIATRFLAAMVDRHRETGTLWEKYNVVDGGIDLPNSRYGNSPYVSWTAAAAAILGRRVFLDETHTLGAPDRLRVDQPEGVA